MYNLELHYLLAKITLLFFLAATITGIMLLTRITLLFRRAKRWCKPIRIIHIITGFMTLLFFLLTYFLVPKI